MGKASQIIYKDRKRLEELKESGLLWSSGQSIGNGGVLRRKGLRLGLFGIPEIDECLPASGLPSGCVHELSLSNQLTSKERRVWHPPLTLITHILRASISQTLGSGTGGVFVWVGKRCWPSVHLLTTTFTNTEYPWEKNSLFIAPANKEKHLWAILQALRSPAVFAVIADASSLTATASRRLQLAAEHGNTLGFLLRPPWELSYYSSAYSKWHLQTVPSELESLRWNLELIRLRGSLKNLATGDFSHTNVSPSEGASRIHSSSGKHSPHLHTHCWGPLEWDFINGKISLCAAEAQIRTETRQQNKNTA